MEHSQLTIWHSDLECMPNISANLAKWLLLNIIKVKFVGKHFSIITGEEFFLSRIYN